MNSFGPALATYRGNKIVIGLFTLLAAGSAFLAWMSLHTSGADSPGDYRIYVLLAILFAAYAVWTWKKFVSLHSEGIVYQNLRGETHMQWDEVEKFYYGATKRSVNFIPVGTYYTYKLLDHQGKKIVLGNAVEQPKALGQKLIELTSPPLLKQAAQQFDSGMDVDFGPIKLNRTKGLTVKKMLGGWKTIPLNEVHSYLIQIGQFCIYGADGKLHGAAGVANIPNVFVLQMLLDAIFAPKAHGAHA